MATQTQSQIEAALRKDLRAAGYPEDVIQFVVEASRERLRRDMVDFVEDGWTGTCGQRRPAPKPRFSWRIIMHLDSSINVHDADDMKAEAKSYLGSDWVALGERRQGGIEAVINLHFSGPDAADKSERLAAAINAAMADDSAPALAAEYEAAP